MNEDKPTSVTARPIALIIVAVLFILLGLAAVAEIVYSLIWHDRWSFNFNALGIFIGIGLLRYQSGWRKCALFFIWVSLIAAPLGLILGIIFQRLLTVGQSNSPASFNQKMGFAGLLIAIFLISWWCRNVLNRPDIRKRFDTEPRGPVQQIRIESPTPKHL